MRDVNGNSIAKVDFTERAAQLVIYSEVILQHYDSNPLDFIVDESAVHYPFVYEPDCQPELAAFMHILYPKDAARLREWLSSVLETGRQDRDHRPAPARQPAYPRYLSIPTPGRTGRANARGNIVKEQRLVP